MPPTCGTPGIRDHSPSLLHVSRTHTCSFAPASQSSCRNRDVAVAPFPFQRRGTLFLPPWRQMPRIMLMSTFLQNCLKLAYVIRIMIITFKMFKIVVCFKLLNDMRIYRNCCLMFPTLFKLPKMCSLLMSHLLPC